MSNFCKDKKVKIYELDTTELDRGIELAIVKAKKHLEASRSLVNHEQFVPYASALFLFALEEYGKSKLLKKSKNAKKSVHKISENIFAGGNAHERKIRQGLKDLPSKTIKIERYIEIKNSKEQQRIISLYKDKTVYVIPGSTGEFSVEGNISIQEEIRWKTFYLDWENDQRFWTSEYRIKKEELLIHIAELEVCLENL